MTTFSHDKRFRPVFPTIVLACLHLAACANSQEKYREHLDTGGKPALHAVHNERLRELMRQFDALTYERMRTGPQIDAERELRSREIAEVSGEMLKTVDYVFDTLPELSLRAREKAVFHRSALDLKRQVTTLNNLAWDNRVDAMPEVFEQIELTCNSCHSLFKTRYPAAGE